MRFSEDVIRAVSSSRDARLRDVPPSELARVLIDGLDEQSGGSLAVRLETVDASSGDLVAWAFEQTHGAAGRLECAPRSTHPCTWYASSRGC